MTDYNPFHVKDKNLLITGASSGIGRTTAIECSKMGATVNIVGRDIWRLSETYSKLEGTNHQRFISDLTIENEVSALVAKLSPLDGIVHSAGIIKRIPLRLINEQNFENILRINLIAIGILTQKLYKNKLIKDGASIVIISSVGANIASIGNILYMASKGGVNSFMKGAALELARHDIRINCIEPGMVKTNLTKGISDEEIQKDVQRYPLGRYCTPEEVAWASIYLLSDATKFITGTFLKIDGGLTLR